MHNLLYQMRQTAAARIAAILKARRPKEVMPSAPIRNKRQLEIGLPVNGAAPAAPSLEAIKSVLEDAQWAGELPPIPIYLNEEDEEQAEFEQWEREAWGV